MRAALSSVAVWVSMVVCVAVASPAAAQSDADREQARALFAAGQAAVDAGRWTDALDAFRHAYELTHVPSALFNAAFALRALGRYREAETSFVELLALEATRPAMRTEAEGYLAEVRERIAHLSLEGLPPGAQPVIRLDATPVVDGGERPLVLPADPGHHLLDVTLEGHQRFEWAGDLTAGQTLPLQVSLPFLLEDDLGPAAAPAPSGPHSIIEEAWFWVVIGVVVVGAAGGIVGGVLADQAAQLQPMSSMPVHL